MSYVDQQAGWVDRVFNSTISLPQQVLWRLYRAWEDEDIDIFSEKGLMDAALIPALGVFDDHKEDVMPDYMAAQTKGWVGASDKRSDTGFSSQLAAAILTDPLTYMTGGLSAIGKVGRSAQLARRSPAFKKVLRGASEKADTSINELLTDMRPQKYLEHIDEAIEEAGKGTTRRAQREVTHLTKMRRGMANALPDAEHLHQTRALKGGATGPASPLDMAETIKQTNDRRIAFGLPGLARFGAKYDISRDYSNWWQVYKDGVNKGGKLAVTAYHLSRLVDVPGVNTALKNMSAPIRHAGAGWRIGREAQVNFPHTASLTAEEVKKYGQWLSPDGAAATALETNRAAEKLGGNQQLIDALKDGYEQGIKEYNLSHEDAFKRAFNSVDIGAASESGAALFGRITGRTKDNTFFPKWQAGATLGKGQIEGLVTTMMEEHAKASKLSQQGRTSIVPAATEAKITADSFEAKAGELAPAFREVAEFSFEKARSAKAAWNTVFRSGTSTLRGERAYAKFVSDVARDNDQLEQITQALYQKLNKLTQGGSTLSAGDVTKLVTKLVELDALPGEIAASFHAAKLNPSNSGRIMLSMDNFLKRQNSSIRSVESLLRHGGITDKATKDKLLAAFDDEIFPFLEFEDLEGATGVEAKRAGGEGQQTLQGAFKRLIKNQREERLIFTPHQKTLMRRVNNRHVVRGADLPLTARQEVAVAKGEPAKQRRLLQKYEGRSAGTLTNDELTEALIELDTAGQRALTQDEIIAAAEEMPAIRQLLERRGNDITVPELLTALSKSGRAETRLIPRQVTEEILLWDAKRASWTGDQAQAQAQQWGFDIVQNEFVDVAGKARPGTFRFEPHHLNVSEMTRFQMAGVTPGMPIPPAGGFRTYGEAMASLRSALKRNPDYMAEHGPGFRTVKKPLRIATKDIEDVKALLSAEDTTILKGKGTKFDDMTLPAEARPDWERLSKLKGRRALPKDHRLHDAPIIPKKERVTTSVDAPRTSDELEIFLDKNGIKYDEGQIGSWAVNYTRGRLLIREVQNAIQRSTKAGMPVEIDTKILADLESHVQASGAIIRDIMVEHLPKEFTEMMNLSQELGAYSFEAAKRAGVWMPGSPVAYLPRFFNKAARSRIAKLIGSIQETDGSILTRLGIRQSQYFKRQWDEMSVDDLNEVYFELREAMTKEGASPALRKFHADLDHEMQKAGIGIAGLKKALPWLKEERVESDAFIALLQRFGVAQQDANLENYFNNMLAASTGKNGEALMLGGKIVGIVDDTGNVQSLPGTQYKARSISRSSPKAKNPVEVVALTQETVKEDYVPKSLLIELPDGSTKTIENNLFQETGFGLLALGGQADDALDGTFAGAAVKEAQETTTLGSMFASASLRSDLHNNMVNQPLKGHTAERLLGQQVVLGSEHNIVGLVKTAAQVHQVTPPALRSFDAINYGIKSFQTIFRLPFHIANLSSGVFQAHLAGATPKNLVASYIDTMRFLAGDQKFAARASMVTDMLDLGSETSSLGIVNLAKGNKALIQQAARLHGSGGFHDFLARKYGYDKLDDLDQVEDLVISLSDGTELDMREFIQTAGEMQLYGTFASSLTRGSRTVSDNIMRIKMQTLEPSMGGRITGAPKRLMERMANVAESSEVINRTATALALVREGHPVGRAIEIAKEAHVPYEKLTPFEKNAFKRFSVYYTFPRHYMPWAWSRFAEDPSKLSAISHFIRDQNVLTTQEGKPNLVLGDYRVDLGRLNANLEAAGMMAAFADRLAMPAVEAVVPGVDGYDIRKLRGVYSDAGITNIGGLAGMALGNNVLRDPDRDPPDKSIFEEATRIAWPFKIMSQLAGKSPKEGVVAAASELLGGTGDERSPYVEYTPLESWLTDSVFGVGTRKVREKHELMRANMAYRKILKRLQLRAAATDDPGKRARYINHIREMSYGLRQILSETKQKDNQ